MECPTCQTPVGDHDVCPACGTAVDSAADERPDRTERRQPGDGQQGGGTPQRQATGGARRSTGSGRHGPAGRRPLPTGLKVVCGLLVLFGLGSLGIGMELRDLGATAARYGADGGGSVETVGLIVAALGVGEIAGAVGLWRRASWGWTAAVAVASAGVLTNLYLLSTAVGSGAGLVGVLVNAGIGWYVYDQRWRFQSGGQRRSTSGGQHANRRVERNNS